MPTPFPAGRRGRHGVRCTLSKCGFVIIQAQAMPNNKSLFGIMVLLCVFSTTQNALPKQGGFRARRAISRVVADHCLEGLVRGFLDFLFVVAEFFKSAIVEAGFIVKRFHTTHCPLRFILIALFFASFVCLLAILFTQVCLFAGLRGNGDFVAVVAHEIALFLAQAKVSR